MHSEKSIKIQCFASTRRNVCETFRAANKFISAYRAKTCQQNQVIWLILVYIKSSRNSHHLKSIVISFIKHLKKKHHTHKQADTIFLNFLKLQLTCNKIPLCITKQGCQVVTALLQLLLQSLLVFVQTAKIFTYPREVIFNNREEEIVLKWVVLSLNRLHRLFSHN